MSRKNAAPTHGWVISSRINKWLAAGFVFMCLVTFITIWTVTYSIRRDCQDYYTRDIKMLSYWLHIEAGSNQPGCPQK